MKRLLRFVRQYKLFSLTFLATLVGLSLELLKVRGVTHIFLGSVAILALLPLSWAMWQDLRLGKYGIDILALTAVVASVILGQDWAALVIILMLTGGKALQNFAEHRARRELDQLLKHTPRQAHVVRGSKLLDVPVHKLQAGDKLLIKAGEIVPVDGVIVEGSASFDEASITGESLPQTKKLHDLLVSGSINLDGAITMKATATAEHSQYQQIVKLVRGASAAQAPFVRLADRYSLPFTFLAFAIAGAVWAVSGQAVRFLDVIVVATPCPLLLAAPVALISGMARASRYGIIIKTGSALERLAAVQTMAFDKTGTLTSGMLQVDQITVFSPHDKTEILTLAASLEQKSHHILAQAIVTAAQSRKLKLIKTKQVHEIAGQGLRAIVKGRQVLIGRLSLLIEQGVQIPSKLRQDSIKQTVTYVAIDGLLAGIIVLKDKARPESQPTLDRLRQLGIRKFMMITGDNLATATVIAKQLGITQIHADALPAEKLHIIEKAEHRPLAFVGDGVNDAPVLTAADVGIALGARGSTAASESADIVILPDDLSRLATATAIAKRTFRIARQSILVGIGLSLLLMVVFATGKFPPLAGAIIQEVVDVIVIVNALRARLGPINA